jgi:GNAT superfamily N-acetyltransferase
MVGLLRSTLRGELDVPAAVQARYPATLHLDLLPQVRGQGIARQLFEQYREAMWKLRVPGIHAQTLSENAAIRGFNLALGFRPVQTQTLTAWSHLDAEPVQVTTWVLDLATSPCR